MDFCMRQPTLDKLEVIDGGRNQKNAQPYGSSTKESKEEQMLRKLLIVLSVLVLVVSGLVGATTRPTVTILAFSQGFCWPELFGSTGLERTDKLAQVEDTLGVNIQIVWGDETTVRMKALTDLISHTGRYDILMVGTDGGVQLYGPGGFLEPLDPYLENSPTEWFDPKAVFPKFLDASRMPPGETLYALPYYSFGAGMIYRKDIFDRYGVTVPTTTDELVEVLQTLKEGFKGDGIDMYPITMRAAPGEEPSLDLLGFVYAYAGYPAIFEGGALTADEIKNAAAKPILNSEDFKAGFEAYVNICREYGPPGIATHTWVDMMNLYAAGKAAILMPSAINGYAARGMTEDPNVQEHSAFALAPIGPSGKRIQSFWSFSVGINSDSKDKAAAWKVLSYLCGEEAIQGFADRTGWPNIPMRSVLYSPTLVEKYGLEEIKLNEESIDIADPYYFPYIPELPDFMDKIGTACSRAVSVEDIDKVLDDLQAWALDHMFKAGYYR